MIRLDLRKGFALAFALLLVGAAVVAAVVTHGSGTSAAAKRTLVKKGGDPDAAASAKATPQEGKGPSSVRYAEEQYKDRAYPGNVIPFQLTKQANTSYDKLALAKPIGGSWQNVGPAGESVPDVLTFFGQHEHYSGRVTALAISSSCTQTLCTVWVGAAGGGIWRTNSGLAGTGSQNWQYLSTPFDTNAIGDLEFQNGVLYAATGEPNTSADSEAGLGVWKSTDGGNTWSKLPSIGDTPDTSDGCSCGTTGTYHGNVFAGRSIGSFVVDPGNSKIIWAVTTRGVRGVAASDNAAYSRPTPPRPAVGVFKSTDGGQTFQYMAWIGTRGGSHLELDPTNHNIAYVGSYNNGIFRSMNGGVDWEQIKPPTVNGNGAPLRDEFAVTKLDNGNTRMYVGEGGGGSTGGSCPDDPGCARFYRSDNVKAPAPVFQDMTNDRNGGYCGGQCWYDNYVYSPKGYPNIVYLLGSFDYNSYGASTNGRGVLLSLNGGQTWRDQTADNQVGPAPDGSCCDPDNWSLNSLHPDQHKLLTNPGNPYQFFEGNDGGVWHSSGNFADQSGQCPDRPTSRQARCAELLKQVPRVLTNMNPGLSTLQFQMLSVNPQNVDQVMGGTQDNGTMQGISAPGSEWPGILYGDGGYSGWNRVDSSKRLASFYGQFHDANFHNGNPVDWVIISGPIASSPEGSNFYAPIIPDPNPNQAGSIFQGSQSVWRTKDWGGNEAYLEANCPEFFTSGYTPTCGDFVRIGPGGNTDLTGPGYGPDRQGCCIGALDRAETDQGTLWATTDSGRVFITKNANAGNPASVVWHRLDDKSPNSPDRVPTDVKVDPNNTNHAFVSYSGYDYYTPGQPGHVFSVWYNPTTDTATFTELDDSSLADLPVTSVAYDAMLGDLYASTDFGVVVLRHGTSTWVDAGTGMPRVEVAHLTVGKNGYARYLYAASHGLSAWRMPLPSS